MVFSEKSALTLKLDRRGFLETTLARLTLRMILALQHAPGQLLSRTKIHASLLVRHNYSNGFLDFPAAGKITGGWERTPQPPVSLTAGCREARFIFYLAAAATDIRCQNHTTRME